MGTQLDATVGTGSSLNSVKIFEQCDNMKLDFGFMHVQGMQAEYNGMGQSGHFPRV